MRQNNYIIQRAIGKRMREIRNRKNRTLKEVSEEIGCTECSLSRYEMGNRIPDCVTLFRISEALKVDIKEFYKYVL